MLPIIPGQQVPNLDSEYILSQGISSLDLMEKAAEAFVTWYFLKFNKLSDPVYIFCGHGNNGGDGVVVARLLSQRGLDVKLIYLQDPENCSEDFKLNFERLPDSVSQMKFDTWDGFVDEKAIIIDAIFGVGINRPLDGIYQRLIHLLNGLNGLKIAIDIPSGLPSDQIATGDVFLADHTVSFQFPKLSLMFPEHAMFIGELHVLDIGIPDKFLEGFGDGKYYLREKDIPPLHLHFHRFSHKGDFGKVLIIGGSYGKTGAINLSGFAALRTGSGLVQIAPQIEQPFSIQPIVPELMLYQENAKSDLGQFDAIACGPGWGLDVEKEYYQSILARFRKPMVIDADGINLLAAYPDLIKELPANSILTPHLKEIERLAGKSSNHLERIEKAKVFSTSNHLILVLKGAHTLISFPDGRQVFNASGNQYMATAGSGDVLTGMIVSFLGQGYSPEQAALCGGYHHGLAGEIASREKLRGMIASDIIHAIPDTFIKLGVV